MILREILAEIVPAQLVLDPHLTAFEVQTYLYLTTRPAANLSAHARNYRMPWETFRRSVARLIEHDWVLARRVLNRIIPTPWMPAEVEQIAVTRLRQARDLVSYKGEWLMRCCLDLLVSDRNFFDNARPQWLVTGDGSGRLELDRWYYSASVAFEFQGAQHFQLGPLTPTPARLHSQQSRDRLKAQLCADEGIRMIYLTAADLDFVRLRRILAGHFGLVSVKEGGPIFRELVRMCRAYANSAAREDYTRSSHHGARG